MISYKGLISDSFREASQDNIWTKKEREILKRIADLLDEYNYDELRTKAFGTGRIYWIKEESKYKFLAHDNPTGYNIGRIY